MGVIMLPSLYMTVLTSSGETPYTGTMLPRLYPVCTELDKLYVCMHDATVTSGSVYLTVDYGLNWSKLEPAGKTAGHTMLYALPFPDGWVFGTLYYPAPPGTWFLYKAATFNGAWTAITVFDSSNNSFDNQPQLTPQAENSDNYWWSGQSHVGIAYRYVRINTSATLIPGASFADTNDKLTRQMAVQISPAVALLAGKKQPNAKNPCWSNALPFLQASWLYTVPHTACSKAAIGGSYQAITTLTTLVYTSSSWAGNTVVNLPADLVSTPVPGTSASIAISAVTSGLILAVGCNAVGSIMRSTDMGANWTTVKSATGVLTPAFDSSIGFFKAQPTWAWALTPTGFWLSKDAGLTWGAYSNGLGI